MPWWGLSGLYHHSVAPQILYMTSWNILQEAIEVLAS
jgi:hypothetical protein